MHPVFHVSTLKKCIGDPTFIISLKVLEVKENLSYEDVIIEILDRQFKILMNKEVFSVKVFWRNQQVEGATWEDNAGMMSRYPHIFTPILACGNKFLLVSLCLNSCVFYVSP